MHMRAPLAIVALLLSVGACEHTTSGNAPKSRLNSPRCVTDIECGQYQHCVKKGHHADGICASK